jgi:hypothetical protein
MSVTLTVTSTFVSSHCELHKHLVLFRVHNHAAMTRVHSVIVCGAVHFGGNIPSPSVLENMLRLSSGYDTDGISL